MSEIDSANGSALQAADAGKSKADRANKKAK